MTLQPILIRLLSAAAVAATSAAAGPTTSPLGVTWGVTYGFPPAKSEVFMPQARRLGAGFSRITLYWSQLEPREGEPRWKDLDAYLDQLADPEEGMVTLASASPWATRTRTWVFPSSPARSPEQYEAFVRRVVEHVKGRVRYFQADTEVSNPFFWSGTAEEYASEQRLFYATVKAADPRVVVVLGGHDGLFDPTGAHPMPGQVADLASLHTVLAQVKGAYDLFDLHLYGDPYTIPARVETVRQAMRAAGAERPIVASEYNGPSFFEFPANRRWSAVLQGPGASDEAVRTLRAKAADLPIETRMFLTPDDAGLPARRLRLQAADLVARNLLALASRVRRTAIFDVWHDTSDPDAPNTVLQGRLKLLDHGPSGLDVELPLATVFRRFATALGNPTKIERLEAPGQPDVYAFRVERRGRGPLLVAWRRSAAPGGDAEPASVSLPWRGRLTRAADMLGQAGAFEQTPGRLQVTVTALPLLVE